MNKKYLAKDRPYLSIIIPCRNDNYAGGMLPKLLNSLTVLINQLNRAKITTEIIIVEWNPPLNKARLSKELSVLKNLGICMLRIIEVDNSYHKLYLGNEKKGVVGAVALNVGIRRAKGKFITSKMADTYYSNQLINFISQKSLSETCVYRADRIDVEADIDNFPIDWEKSFNKNILYRGSYNKTGPHTKACGDFMLMSNNSWRQIKGFAEPKSVIGLGEDGEALYAAIGIGLNQVCLDGNLCVYKIKHNKTSSDRLNKNQNIIINKLHNFSNRFEVLLNYFKIRESIIVSSRLILGIFNLPKTKIHGIKVRSHYRWYLIALFRLKFGGANFLKNKNWGLKKSQFKEFKLRDGE
jgi:hypothetical protein